MDQPAEGFRFGQVPAPSLSSAWMARAAFSSKAAISRPTTRKARSAVWLISSKLNIRVHQVPRLTRRAVAPEMAEGRSVRRRSVVGDEARNAAGSCGFTSFVFSRTLKQQEHPYVTVVPWVSLTSVGSATATEPLLDVGSCKSFGSGWPSSVWNYTRIRHD
jgi:hypothetical protein